jgi:hypothetical protein
VTGGFSFCLSLIYIGSPTAFYAITSLMTVALLQCYMFSIGSILWRRIKYPETLPTGTFMLGKWGIPLNAFAVVWCAWSFVSRQADRITCSPMANAGQSSGHSGRYTHPSLLMASTGHPSYSLQSSFSRLFGTSLEDTRPISALLYLSRKCRYDGRKYLERVENR